MNDRDVAFEIIATAYRRKTRSESVVLNSINPDPMLERAVADDSYRFARDVLDALERRGLMIAAVPAPWTGHPVNHPALDDAP